MFETYICYTLDKQTQVGVGLLRLYVTARFGRTRCLPFVSGVHIWPVNFENNVSNKVIFEK